MSEIPYAEARARIASGDVLLFEGRSLASRLIRLRTESRLSHAGLAFWAPGRLGCLEAVGRGVQLWPLRNYVEAGHRVWWYRLAASPAARDVVCRRALERWGAPYAHPRQFLRSWGLFARRLARWGGWPLDTHPERVFCSELVAEALLAAGLAEGIEPARTAPGDLVFLPCLQLRGLLVP